jgi:hypothetical protein
MEKDGKYINSLCKLLRPVCTFNRSICFSRRDRVLIPDSLSIMHQKVKISIWNLIKLATECTLGDKFSEGSAVGRTFHLRVSMEWGKGRMNNLMGDLQPME